jgi:hypothetical protein
MDGVPVYLVSLSRRDFGGKIIPASTWSAHAIKLYSDLMRSVIAGLGDESRERIFRMNVTLCLHRALTEAEILALPEYFHTDPPIDIAGGPVKIIWENTPGSPSTRPCENPIRDYETFRGHPELWIPEDCGQCGPCLARARIMEARS